MSGLTFLLLLALGRLGLAESLKVGNCEYRSVRSNIDAEVLYEPTTFDECSQYCTRNTTCTAFRHEDSFCGVVTEDVGTDINDAESGFLFHSKLSECQPKPKTAGELFGDLYDNFEVMIEEEGLVNGVKSLLNSVNFADLDVDNDDLISHSERDPMVEGLVNLFETVLFKDSRTIEEVREFAVFPVVDVSELEGSDLDWACEHVFGMQYFDVQAEDEMNVSAQEFSSVVNEFLHAYLENVDIADWDSITFANAQILSLSQLVIPEQCQHSERRNLGTSACTDWSDYRYVCGDDSNSGHGWTGDYTAKSVGSLNECLDWCHNTGSGCCEHRGAWCLLKPTGVIRYSWAHSDARVAMCSGKDYMCILGQGSSGLIASTNMNNAQECGDLCKKINGCVRFDYTTSAVYDACRLYSSEWRDLSSKGNNRYWCKENENRCIDSSKSEWGILHAPQAKYWACCAGCPAMRGVSKYDTCNKGCGCICQNN